MLKLSSVFSDGALFLHSAPLVISGESDSMKVKVLLTADGVTVSEYYSDVADGIFSVTVQTPAPSFKKYEIRIESGADSHVMRDVLFGELFLASGQSNMEWPTKYVPHREEIYENIKGKNIRIYYGKPKQKTDNMPKAPERYHIGSWTGLDGAPTYEDASALATSFAISLYDFFKKEGRDIPVGILSLSVGGVSIESYFPLDEIMKDEFLLDYINERWYLPSDERWNNVGELNREQPTSLYNYLIAPVLGVKARAMLWYQGESNATYEESKRKIYAYLLEFLHRAYKERFAPDVNGAFPIFCSDIFHWSPSADENRSCIYYRINDAILSLSKKNPEEFYTIPITDLNMSWCFYIPNHPIHPSHKLEIGRRFAAVISAALFGRRSAQRRPAYMRSVKRSDGKIYVRFYNAGSGLYIKGAHVKGLYVRSKRGEYIRAEANVTSKDTLEVYSPTVKEPYHVAYATGDLEYGSNLFAGEYPVIPFSTELPRRVMRKPWLDTSIDSEVVAITLENGSFDYFPRPVYYPIADEELCYDNFYSLTGRSLRVRGNGEFGFKVKAARSAPLDLYNYSSLTVALLSFGELRARIRAIYDDGKTIECKGVLTKTRYGTFDDYTFDLSGIKRGVITELHFVFETDYPYVCADSFSLTPKK